QEAAEGRARGDHPSLRRAGRPQGLREQVSAPVVGRHAPARRRGARARQQPDRAADGRAVRRRRRHDAPAPGGGTDRDHDTRAHHGAVHHPCHRGGGVPVGPRGRPLGPTRPHRCRSRDRAAAAAPLGRSGERRPLRLLSRRAYALHPRQQGMRTARALLTELFPFVAALALWQALSAANVWPRVLFPSPFEVAQTFATDLVSGVLLVDLAVSLKSLLLGFAVGSAIAVPLGYLMGLSRASRNFFDPLVNLLQAIPGLAWIPFAILWFGLGQGAVTFIIVMSVFFPALPNLLTGIRLGIAFGFRSLVGGEMIASTDGLGYAIFNAQQYFQSARIVVGMLTIGITWLLMDRLILRPIEQRTTLRWGLVREGLETA